MDMYDEKIILCGANSYEKKYYLNPDFGQLPDRSGMNCRLCACYIPKMWVEY